MYLPGEDALYFTTQPRPGRISPPASVKRLALDGDRFPLEADRITVVDADLVTPNGMAAGPDGSLIVCDQGNLSVPAQLRRLVPRTGETSTIVDAWHGRRLNSPNDVVVKSDGTIWFTDPAYGYLQRFRPEPRVGDFVCRFDPVSGSLSVVADSFSKPNGIAFSPDESVGDWDPEHKVVMRYDVTADGSVAGGIEFFDTTGADGEDAIDGIKVDARGNLYACGPSGIWVIAPDGRHLGTLHLPENPHNLAWGDADGRGLYVTALTSIYRLRLNVAGIRPVQTGARS